MATNPYLDIFGLTDEDEDEETLVTEEPAPEPEPTDNPYLAIFRGEEPTPEPEPAPTPEPVAEPEPAPREPSWMERVGAPSAGSFMPTPGLGQDVGFGEDAAGRVVQGFAMPFGEAAKAAAVKDVEQRRLAATAAQPSAMDVFGLKAPGPEDEMAAERAYQSIAPELREEAVASEAALDVADIRNQPEYRAGQALQDFVARNFPTDPERDDEILSKALAGAGTLGAFATASLINPLATAALGAGTNASLQFADAIRHDASLEDALTAFNIGAAVGATEALPVEFALSRLDRATGGWFSKTVTGKLKSKLAKVGAEGTMGAITEAFQEAFTEFANNFTARDIVGYDEERQLLAGTGESAGLGGGLGFLMNTLTASIGMKRRATAERRVMDALVPDIDSDVARETAVDAMSPDRASAYLPEAQPAELPSIDIEQDLGTTALQTGAPVALEGDITIEEGTALGDVKKAAEKANAAVREAVEPVTEPKAPATPAREPYDVQTDYDNGYYTFSIEGDKTKENDYDTLSATESDDGYTVKIDTANVAEERQKQGRGTALYEKLFATAARKGQTVESADSITAPAMKTWQALKRAGYKVEFNPSLRSVTKDGELKFEADGPVAQITPEMGQVSDTTPLFRGLKEGGTARGYPGEFVTEDEARAQQYARTSTSEGTVETREHPLASTFDIDEIAATDQATKDALWEEYKAFAQERGVDPEEGYLFEVLQKGETDFVYPTREDVEFLRSKGYDNVRFEQEGGEQVKTRFLFDEGPAAVEEDTGIEVTELTPEQLEQELGTLPESFTPKTFALAEGIPVQQTDVRAAMESAQEFERLTGTAPEAPRGPMTDRERLDMIRNRPFRLPVNERITSLADIADNLNASLSDTASVELQHDPETNEIKLVSRSGSGVTLTEGDVRALRYADQGSIGKSGVINYLRLKADAAGITWKGKKRSPNFVRTKTGQMARDMGREVILNINGTRVNIAAKLSVLNNQWKRKTGKELRKADRDQMQDMNAYLSGDMSLDDVTTRLDLTPDMRRNLASLRTDIDVLSLIMISEGMVPNQLQFQIGENLGSYVRIQYAMKDIAARAKDPEALLNKIPEERRNAVANALVNAYLSPAMHGNLHKMNRGTLTRLAQTYGLVSNKVVGGETRVNEDGETVPAEEEPIIAGTNISLRNSPITEVAAELSARLKGMPVIPENVMLRFLQGGIGGAQASMHGREKSAERARKLSRTREQFKEAGFTDEEIALHQAFREMLLEHVDPISTVQQTVNTMLNHIASHRIVNALAELSPVGAVSLRSPNHQTGARMKLVESGDKWADVRVVDPVTGEDIPASDVYVRPEIRQVFDRLVRPNFSDNPLADVYRTFQTITKVNLTAQNAGSHFRNARSSAEIAATRGYVFNTSPARVLDSIRVAAQIGKRDVLSKEWNEEALDRAAAYLAELGILHDSVRTGSIKEIMMRMSTSEDFEGAFGPNSYLTAGGRDFNELLSALGDNKLVDMIRKGAYELPLAAYRLEDEGPKMAAFVQEREIIADMMDRPDLVEVMQGKRPATESERQEIQKIDRKAAKKIRNLFPTYSNVPEFVKDLSANLFVTPFPSFNAEMIRNWAHDSRDMVDMGIYVAKGDVRPDSFYAGMNRTKVAKRLLERQVSWAAMAAYYQAILSSIGFAAGYVLSLPFGAEPDDEDEITQRARELTENLAKAGYKPTRSEFDALDPFFRALMPEWAQSNLYQVVDFKPGESITVMDMSFTVPYSQLLSLGINSTGAISSAMTGDFEGAGRATAQGVMQFLGEWVTEEPLLEAVGELWTGESDFGELEGWERADSLLKMITPGSQTYRSAQRLLGDPADEHSQELMDFALGQRPFTLHFEKKYVDAIWPEKLKMRAASVDIRDLVREAAETNMSPDKFARKYQALEEERKQAMARIEFINEAADVLGLSKAKRRKAISQSTLSGDNRIKKHQLLDGSWRATFLTPRDIYPENQRPDAQTTSEYNKWLREMRKVQRENGWR